MRKIRILIVLLSMPIACACSTYQLPISNAVYRGDLGSLKTHFAQGQDVNTAEDGNSLLFIAAEAGQDKIVAFLIDQGAELNSRGTFNGIRERTPLMVASYLGHQTTVELLIQSQANVHLTDINGATALFLAALRGHDSVVSSLIQAGANVNHRDKWNSPLINAAAQRQNLSTVKLLIEAGADVCIRDYYGRTPYDWGKLPFYRRNAIGDYLEPFNANCK